MQSDTTATPAEQRAALRAMSSEQRHAAYRRGELTPVQLFFWANRFPSEPPLLNGELEWIAVRTPEVAEAPAELSEREPGGRSH